MKEIKKKHLHANSDRRKDLDSWLGGRAQRVGFFNIGRVRVLQISLLYFFHISLLIFVLKYSRRWWPPIGGCKMFEPPFWAEMSNLIRFFCKISLPHTFCPIKTCFQPLWSTPEPPGASSFGTLWWLLLNSSAALELRSSLQLLLWNQGKHLFETKCTLPIRTHARDSIAIIRSCYTCLVFLIAHSGSFNSFNSTRANLVVRWETHRACGNVSLLGKCMFN